MQTLFDIPAKGAAVRDDSEQAHARSGDDALRAAREAEERASAEAERAKAEAERVTAEATSVEGQREGVRQLGLIYGGLIGVAVLMVQPFLAAPSLDVSARISIIAFSVAIPLLAGLVMVNWQETFRGRRTTSVTVTVAQGVAQAAAVTGIAAGFWHVTWVAGVTFLVAGFVAMLVHSAGWWRLESPREATRSAAE
jgi:tetrahydromethanopterin S-methyltransferase subunit G